MTFNSNAKPNRIIVQAKVNIGDAEASELISQIEVNYIDYERNLAYLKEYEKGITTMSQKEYLRSHSETKNAIENIKKEIVLMISNTEKLSQIEIFDSYLKSKSLECLKTVSNKVRPRQTHLEHILNEIIKKEHAKNETIKTEVMKESANRERTGSNPQNQIYLKESLIEVKDLEFNKQLLNEREKELIELQMASAQIREITKYMGIKVVEQGTIINSIEANVVEVKENIENADDQIIKADKDVSSTGKKLCVIVLLIALVVSIVVTVVVLSII